MREIDTKALAVLVARGGPEPGWTHHAACAGDLDNLEPCFPTRGETVDAGIQVCSACPVRDQCLAEALINDERWGIWGGLTTTERDAVSRGLYEVAS